MGRFIALVILVIGFAVLVYGGRIHIETLLFRPLNVNDGYLLVVKPGSSVSTIGNTLTKLEVLPDSRILSVFAQITGRTNIKIGTYKVDADDSLDSLLDKLQTGEEINHRVTLLEGWNRKQIAAELKKSPELNWDINLSEVGIENSVYGEGWFFPDTYFYPSGYSVKKLYQRASNTTQRLLEKAWSSMAEDLPYTNQYELLIMASLIEKETGADEERERIAGVFINRLHKRMRLQTDPTVIYALGDNYNGNIRRKHLRLDSPYNTYRVHGLPPTPIASPSARSIEAAANPERHNLLYFVAKGDGRHYFSMTLEEHNKAVRRYQIMQRKKSYRSVPK